MSKEVDVKEDAVIIFSSIMGIAWAVLCKFRNTLLEIIRDRKLLIYYRVTVQFFPVVRDDLGEKMHLFEKYI